MKSLWDILKGLLNGRILIKKEIKINKKIMWNLEKNENIIQNLEILAKQRFNDSEAKVSKINDNLYSLETDWNINGYVNEEWKVIANPSIFSDYDNYNELLELTWYKEKKDWKLYRMYRLKDWKEIDKYSLEYFQIWVDINFYEAYRLSNLKINNRISSNQLKKLLPSLIETWSFRIKDLTPFLKRKQISEEEFKKELPKLVDLLKKQIIDIRFKKINDEVSEQEIKDYFENWYIGELYTKELLSILKFRQEKTKTIEIEKKEIYSETIIETNKILKK